MTEQELIEKMAIAIRAKNWGWDDWHQISDEAKELYRNEASVSLSALPIPLPVLLGLINGEIVAVPVEASPEMIEAGVDYRLNTSVHAGNGWPEDTSALFSAMIEARPK